MIDQALAESDTEATSKLKHFYSAGQCRPDRDATFIDTFMLIVQHSDQDPVFQGLVLNDISRQAFTVDTIDAAYLEDRVDVAMGQDQKFGTQLTCVEGRRVPLPVAEPARLDQRRLALGMKTISQYIAYVGPC
jgi:hypothetical protein